jgi:hypothetical protein
MNSWATACGAEARAQLNFVAARVPKNVKLLHGISRFDSKYSAGDQIVGDFFPCVLSTFFHSIEQRRGTFFALRCLQIMLNPPSVFKDEVPSGADGGELQKEATH